MEPPGEDPKGLRIVGGSHGLMDLYSTAQVTRLLGVPAGRLRWWNRCGLVPPSGRDGSRKLYTFRDLVGLRAARDLTDRGLSAARIRRVIHRLAADLDEVKDPIVKLRVFGNDRSLVIERDGCEVEAETGQILIDFHVSKIAAAADRTVSLDPSGRNRTGGRSAYEWFLEGSRLEEDGSRWDDAEKAYVKALDMDAKLASAATNLGNLLFRTGRSREAEDLYRKAIQADPDQPQAYYNMGFLKLDGGRADLAIVFFQKALGLDPAFADARFNLGVALEHVGRLGEARREFSKFLAMEPSSAWAQVARLHLERMDGGGST